METEDTNEIFVSQLGAFTEQLKEAHKLHSEHISSLDKWQKQLFDQNTKLLQIAIRETDSAKENDTAILHEAFKQQAEDIKLFEKAAKTFQTNFEKYIDEANFQLGMYSNHWGGYIEALGVHYMLNTLRKDYGVHTSFQKFKRFWHKSRNVEIDLLALSDTHMYIVEVKNQLKDETFIQMLKTLDKIREKVPEYNHLKICPVFVCMHADKKVIHSTVMSGLWVLRYKGFDRDSPIDSFEWLRKDNQP